MKTALLLTASVGTFVMPCLAQPTQTRPAQTRRDAVRFEFSTKRGDYDTPHTNVYLRAGGRRTLVLQTVGAFQPLKRADFRERRVPRTALAACSLWWAGGGDNLYVVRRGHALAVYHQGLDEQAPDEQAPDEPYRLLKIVRAGQR